MSNSNSCSRPGCSRPAVFQCPTCQRENKTFWTCSKECLDLISPAHDLDHAASPAGSVPVRIGIPIKNSPNISFSHSLPDPHATLLKAPVLRPRISSSADSVSIPPIQLPDPTPPTSGYIDIGQYARDSQRTTRSLSLFSFSPPPQLLGKGGFPPRPGAIGGMGLSCSPTIFETMNSIPKSRVTPYARPSGPSALSLALSPHAAAGGQARPPVPKPAPFNASHAGPVFPIQRDAPMEQPEPQPEMVDSVDAESGEPGAVDEPFVMVPDDTF